MKILVGMPSKDSWGGPISSEPPFVDALRELGHDVTEEVYVYGDKEKPTPFLRRVSRVLKTALRFRKLLKSNDFDVIHLNSAFDLRTILRDSFSLFVMTPGKTRVFFKFHGSEAPQFFETNFAIRFLINFLKSRMDGVGVHTTEEISDLERLAFERPKIFQTKNAIPLEIEHSGLGTTQKDPGNVFHLLFVSRFVPKKGLLETIEAVSILRKKGYELKLFCVGDGDLKGQAKVLADRLGLDQDIEFTGYIPEEEVALHLQTNDILVFPTRFGEGFPNVFFKAMAAGMPIVSTRFRAAGDYLDGEKNCLFCQPEPEDLAEKIAKLIDDRDRRDKMSAANREFGKTFSPENIAKEFVAIYRELIEKA